MKCNFGVFFLYTSFVGYLFVGGGIFYWLETAYNLQLNATSSKDLPNGTSSVLAVTDAWDVFAGTFLAMSILTTVGYGNFVPHTEWGKVFTIIYGTLGIPLTGLVLAKFSDNFGEKLLVLHESQRKRFSSESRAIFVATAIFLTCGFSVFMFLPALAFSELESWSYLDAFYFSFVTVTTIGFGDIVAAQHGNENWLWLYRTLTLVWSFFGIGYWLVVAQFITKALKSKRLRMRWQEAKRALSVQADEIKAVLDDQMHKKEFVPMKSKVIMDFLLDFSASMCDIDVEGNQMTYIPGINALMEKRRGGVSALFNLPLALMKSNGSTEKGPVSKMCDENLNESCALEEKAPSGSSAVASRQASQTSFNLANLVSGDEVHVERKRKISKTKPILLRDVDPVTTITALHHMLDRMLELDDNRVNRIMSDCIDMARGTDPTIDKSRETSVQTNALNAHEEKKDLVQIVNETGTTETKIIEGLPQESRPVGVINPATRKKQKEAVRFVLENVTTENEDIKSSLKGICDEKRTVRAVTEDGGRTSPEGEDRSSSRRNQRLRKTAAFSIDSGCYEDEQVLGETAE